MCSPCQSSVSLVIWPPLWLHVPYDFCGASGDAISATVHFCYHQPERKLFALPFCRWKVDAGLVGALQFQISEDNVGSTYSIGQFWKPKLC